MPAFLLYTATCGTGERADRQRDTLAVTLVLMLVSRQGIWQTVDFRLTTQAGAVLDDAAPKQVMVVCGAPGAADSMLLGFGGLAQAGDGTPMVQWVRETLRGEQRTIDETMELLRDRAKRDIGLLSVRHKAPVVFDGGVLAADGRRYMAQVTNAGPDGLPTQDFRYGRFEVERSGYFANGSGSEAISSSDRTLLEQQMKIRPDRMENRLRLLAKVNRRAAERRRDVGVSPWCHGAYITSEASRSVGMIFREMGDVVEELFALDLITFGIDQTELNRDFHDRFKRSRETGEPMSPDRRDGLAQRAVDPRP